MIKTKNIKKLTSLMGLAGITTLISVSALAQYYPSPSFFQPSAYYYQSEDECLDFQETNNIVDNLKNNECFQILASYLEESGLSETHLKQRGEFTIFAPSDEAFAKLSPELLQPENLKQILKYHLVSGVITDTDINRKAVATMLEHNSVQINGVPIGDTVGVQLNKALASDTIKTSNGFIVIIDQVLLPPNLESTLIVNQ